MALSGVHIAFGQCGLNTISNTSLVAQPAQATLLATVLASQTMANAGTSTVAALTPTNGSALPLLSLAASAAIYYAVGPNPDATNGPRRYYDPATGALDIYCNVGDKVAWILA